MLIIILALIFWYGAVLVAKNAYSLGDILTVFTLLLFSLAGANTIAGFGNISSYPFAICSITYMVTVPQISNSKDTARRVLRLYNLPRNSHEIHGARRLDCRGGISFRGVNFAYPTRPDTVVLRNFNLEIAAGECVALVGLVKHTVPTDDRQLTKQYKNTAFLARGNQLSQHSSSVSIVIPRGR